MDRAGMAYATRYAGSMAPTFPRHRLVLLEKCNYGSEIAYLVKVKNMLTEDVNAIKTESRYALLLRKAQKQSGEAFPGFAASR